MPRKYPFIRQTGFKDCAAACVYMIIKYYHGFISMNELNERLKITRNGTTAYHIVKTLETLGFKAYGYKGKYQDLKKQPVPFIANVIINNSYKHFMVVYEIHDDYLLVADPRDKICKIKVTDFKEIWTEVSIHMYPIKAIVNKKNISVKFLLKKLVISNKKFFFGLLFLSLLISLITIILSFFLQMIFDNIRQTYIIKIFIFFFLLFLGKIFLEFLRNFLLIILNKKIDKYLTNKVFSQIIHLPYSYYHGKTSGEVLSRINDLEALKNLFTNVILILFTNLPLLIMSMLILVMLNFSFFLVVFLIFIIYILITLLFSKKLNHLVFAEKYQKAETFSYMTESIRGFETIKGLGLENKVINKFKGLYQKQLLSTYSLNKFYNWVFLLKEFIDVAGQFVLIFLALLSAQKGILSPSFLITYLILTSYFFTALKTILNFDLEIKEALEAVKRIMDLTYYKDDKKYLNELKINNIEVKNLYYSYDDVNFILKHIDLCIQTGEKILITGSSGSGKSTLLKLIMKFYKIPNNYIYLNKVDINKISNEIINNNIVYIGQNETFFTGTLLDNLLIRGDNYIKGVQVSMLQDVISKDSLGYYMLLEENAFNLSGGQKQRLALARSLQNFNILLIDEGLSQVSISMERQILKNIFRAFPNKTVIVVTHRLDNLDLFARYIKLEKGKIIIDAKRR